MEDLFYRLSSMHTYCAKVRWVRKKGGGRRKWENVKGRVARLLPTHCMILMCECGGGLFFKSVLHSHSFIRDLEVESKDNDRTKEEREIIFFLCHKEGEDIRGKDGGLFIMRVVGQTRPVRVLSPSQLCSQMERMQRDGELDHMEQPSPLTEKEKLMIQNSWAKVFQNCDDAGVAILVRYSSHSPSFLTVVSVGSIQAIVIQG